MPKSRQMQIVSQSKKITYESVLQDALIGISKGIGILNEIMLSPQSEDKDKIAAVKAMLEINVKLASAQVVENLPLLKQLEQDVRKLA